MLFITALMNMGCSGGSMRSEADKAYRLTKEAIPYIDEALSTSSFSDMKRAIEKAQKPLIKAIKSALVVRDMDKDKTFVGENFAEAVYKLGTTNTSLRESLKYSESQREEVERSLC